LGQAFNHTPPLPIKACFHWFPLAACARSLLLKDNTPLLLTCANCHNPALSQDFNAVIPSGNEQRQAISSNNKDQAKTKTKARFHEKKP